VSTTTSRHTVHRARVATLSNGHPLDVVVHRITGVGDGPRVAMIGGIHGDEPLGVETVRQILLGLEHEEFAGEVLAIPLANAYAFQTLTRNTPLDMSNLNRVFPGDPNGVLTEQLASTIVDELLCDVDVLIDFHSGGNLATVDYVYMHDDGRLSSAFACEIIYRSPSFAGSLGDYARSQGVTVVVSELGGGQQRNDYYLAKGVRGARNVMKALAMLEGEPELPERQVIVDRMTYIRPHQGGMMLSNVTADRLGEEVPGGFELATIIDPATFEELETITAPYERSLLVLVREPVTKVDPGDYGFIIADASSATPVGAAT
jgi:predicted deacylase